MSKTRRIRSPQGVQRTKQGVLTQFAALAMAVCFAVPACTVGGGGDGGGGDDDNKPEVPFEPVKPQVYVAKVKSLLTGLAATDAEIKAVTESPKAIRGLIDQWMEEPSFKERMLDFFRNAFQQNQVSFNNLEETFAAKLDYPTPRAQFVRNVMDSFPLTVWQLMSEGRPFTEALTTNRYMLTTGLMALMSHLDDRHTGDNGTASSRLAARNPVARFTMSRTATHSLAETLNPASPNYMVWPARNFGARTPPISSCATMAVTKTSNGANDLGFYYGDAGLFGALWGGVVSFCNNFYTVSSQFEDADWNDWRMVTVNVTNDASASANPSFYEVIKLRNASTLTLHTQRLGFFGTLAFDANWPTNAANSARVTANQALIVALGASVGGEAVPPGFALDPADADHAGPACIGCHAQLDPLRKYFRQSYTVYYSDQTGNANGPGTFMFDGVNATGNGVADLANTLAAHPRFALAWAEKLHFWATSTAALSDDPELLRVAAAFKDSNFEFKTLVRELFSSPLITLESKTKTTAEKGVLLSISRRDQFCAALSSRLGLPDACGMHVTKPTTIQAKVNGRAVVMPVDTYNRGFALPSLPTRPDLFYRQSAESVCGLIADQVVDATGTSKYRSQNAEAAMDDFVATVMNIPPSDARSAPARAILADNYTASIQANATPTDALKATFTLACISPTSMLVGL